LAFCKTNTAHKYTKADLELSRRDGYAALVPIISGIPIAIGTG